MRTSSGGYFSVHLTGFAIGNIKVRMMRFPILSKVIKSVKVLGR
jgi:hypothetical protein